MKTAMYWFIATMLQSALGLADGGSLPPPAGNYHFDCHANLLETGDVAINESSSRSITRAAIADFQIHRRDFTHRGFNAVAIIKIGADQWKHDPGYVNPELPDFLSDHSVSMRFFGAIKAPQVGFQVDVAIGDGSSEWFSAQGVVQPFTQKTISATANLRKVTHRGVLVDHTALELSISCFQAAEGEDTPGSGH